MVLYRHLLVLRPKLVIGAQHIYDEWDQDADGFAWFGEGGICDNIADEFSRILSEAGIDTLSGGQDGDDHTWSVAYDEHKAYAVDIPYHIYENGAGYNWKKIHGVKFTTDDIVIFEINRGDLDV